MGRLLASSTFPPEWQASPWAGAARSIRECSQARSTDVSMLRHYHVSALTACHTNLPLHRAMQRCMPCGDRHPRPAGLHCKRWLPPEPATSAPCAGAPWPATPCICGQRQYPAGTAVHAGLKASFTTRAQRCLGGSNTVMSQQRQNWQSIPRQQPTSSTHLPRFLQYLSIVVCKRAAVQYTGSVVDSWGACCAKASRDPSCNQPPSVFRCKGDTERRGDHLPGPAHVYKE